MRGVGKNDMPTGVVGLSSVESIGIAGPPKHRSATRAPKSRGGAHQDTEDRLVDCEHRNVVVTYCHPHGDIDGVRIADLLVSTGNRTREIVTLTHPRCADCGRALQGSGLSGRVKRGGDLFDERSRFVW
jgi:hypothetical protein